MVIFLKIRLTSLNNAALFEIINKVYDQQNIVWKTKQNKNMAHENICIVYKSFLSFFSVIPFLSPIFKHEQVDDILMLWVLEKVYYPIKTQLSWHW